MSERSPTRIHAGFTLIELLLVVVILAVLAVAALPFYFRIVERARSSEAVASLQAIRGGELLYHAQHGTFVEVIDLPAINAELQLELTARYFDYEVARADGTNLLIVATGRTSGGSGPLRVTMDQGGQITYTWPGDTAGGGSNGTGIGIGGGGEGIGAGSGIGGGGGGGGVGGFGGGGSGGGTGGGESTGGSSTQEAGGTAGGVPLFIGRGADLWTDWPDVNAKNITGTTGTEALSQAFDFVASSVAKAVTDDLFRKGAAISFGSALDFSGSLANAIAFFNYAGIGAFPSTPSPLPFIKFNPLFINEAPKVLAAVLVHEGTHFQQFLDGTISEYLRGSKTVIDVEFRAWWNEAVYWQTVRTEFLPIDTTLEDEEEKGYQAALRGEGALRDYITPLYT